MKTASIFEELEGKTIDGKFALLERLGGSEESAVFLTLRMGGQRALIKLVLAEGATAEATLARWEAAKALSHPHLIRVYESGSTVVDSASLVYVVTEAADDVLSTILRERPLDPLETRDTFGPMLDALSYLHATGIVHGHVKPANTLRIDNTVKLSADDFLVVPGVRQHDPKRTSYDAPELVSGKFTPAADVWSLGMMLCEAMSQRLPSLAVDGGLVVPDELPKSLASIAKDCLRFNPDQRCTISEIITRLAPGLSLPPEFFSSGPARPAAPALPPEQKEPASSVSAQDLKIVEALNAPAETRDEIVREADRTIAPVPSRWQQDDLDPAYTNQSDFNRSRVDESSINQFGPEPPRRSVFTHTPQRQPSANWQSKWESDTSAPLPELFTHYEEEESRRLHVAPFFFGALVLLGIVVFVLVRNGTINIADLQQQAQEKYNALTHSAPPPPPQTQSSAPTSESSPSATEPNASEPNASQPAATEPAQPQTPTATSPDETQPATPAQQPGESTSATPAPKPEPPASQPSRAAATPVPSQAVAPPPAPAHLPPALPANADGAIAHQVMPSVSQAAVQSMHGPVRVIVRVDVNSRGDVSHSAYVSPGEGNYFARTSRRAADQWKFQPPRSHGRSEDSVWTLHFYFSGNNVDVTAVQNEP